MKNKHSKHRHSEGSYGAGLHGNQFAPSRSSLLNIPDSSPPIPHDKKKQKHKNASSLRESIASAIGKPLAPDGREEAEEIDEIEVLKQRQQAREHERKKEKKKRKREERERRERNETDAVVREKQQEREGKRRKVVEPVTSSSLKVASDLAAEEWNGFGSEAAQDAEMLDESMVVDSDQGEAISRDNFLPSPWSISKKRVSSGPQAMLHSKEVSEDVPSSKPLLIKDHQPPQQKLSPVKQRLLQGNILKSESPSKYKNLQIDLTSMSNGHESSPKINITSSPDRSFTPMLDELEEPDAPSTSSGNVLNVKKVRQRQSMPSSSSTLRESSAPEAPPIPRDKPRVRKSMAARVMQHDNNDSEDSFNGLFMDPTPKTSRAPSENQPSQRQSSQSSETVNAQRQRKGTAKALLEHRRSLPIWGFADEIRSYLGESNTLVLIGETGSGKSTQIGQFLLSEPWFPRRQVQLPPEMVTNGRNALRKIGGCVAITQPRRVAATNLAKRVAQEMGCALGDDVGFSIRFDSNCSWSTRIKYLTDGMLLKEILRDPFLLRYSAVVVDEAHERSLATDLGMGFLKQLVELRAKHGIPLKLIVMSATLNEKRMASYIGANPLPEGVSADEPPPAPICKIPGKLHPVKVLATPETILDTNIAAVDTVIQINETEDLPGDVLVFLAGQDDIEAAADQLEEMVDDQAEKGYPKMVIRRLYAALGNNEQQSVFAKTPEGCRKIILATNIAETSVTITGVRHVIDSGKCKMKRFRQELGIDSLLAVPISKASAQQRKGRAGREGPGKCFRLYPDSSYYKLQDTTPPEILNCDIASALLTLKARDVSQVFDFPLMDRPPRESFHRGLLLLHNLGALDDAGDITSIGRRMAEFPLSPTDARILLAAGEKENDVVLEVVDILACLSVDNILKQPIQINSERKFRKRMNNNKKPDNEDESSDDDEETFLSRIMNLRRSFTRPEGDHLTLLTLLRKYFSLPANMRKAFCSERYLNISALNRALDTRRQLRTLCKKEGLIPSNFELKNPYESETTEVHYPPTSTETAQKILKVFVTAMWSNTAMRGPDGKFRTMEKKIEVGVHPNSVLKDSIDKERSSVMDKRKGGKGTGAGNDEGSKVEDGNAGQAILFQEVVYTTKAFARCVSRINPAWIAEYGLDEGFR